MNTFGRLFCCTTFGESHGPGLGVVVDGCPPGIPLNEDLIQPYMDRRRPGRDPTMSPRAEPDHVEILSGVFEGRTTGMPIAILIRSIAQRSSDYDTLRSVFRPGHADYTYHQKYGHCDHRGGGRSSGRETAARVAAGAVAFQCLTVQGISIRSRILEIHGNSNPDQFEAEILQAKESGDSVGGIIEIVAHGCPPGLGDPVFGKLDAAIAGAMMGIGSIKGVEIGEGFAAARMSGSEHNDPIRKSGFATNHAGGILGGISNGDPIVIRCAVKPTPSIPLPQQTINSAGEEVGISIRGRHDPCIVPRVLVVAECMLALVLIDAVLMQKRFTGF
ncbi:MAG: Chorismate synthase [Methanomicrobiales archaeon 53_19]|uniref:chorismate synthase n=1 Tax=Methanocalculus sp. TaxID=2004547 RepID=UPI0007495048|nr:chorismate synthase [Methanocalculus sp.]KUK70726.1 MAG: Chorismate synthase [Methanocalculus sp. 52_23]KUL04270.1 MAG: Chorismate synthase [Methanomicrobiales archaeon 53_19]HIJ06027.1 chorismate synthase [Methanocalculus sp.]